MTILNFLEVFVLAFWVYENWKNNGHRARVHNESCIHFKTNEDGNPKSCIGSKWHGPFENSDEAQNAAIKTGGKVSCCRVCLKNTKSR